MLTSLCRPRPPSALTTATHSPRCCAVLSTSRRSPDGEEPAILTRGVIVDYSRPPLFFVLSSLRCLLSPMGSLRTSSPLPATVPPPFADIGIPLLHLSACVCVRSHPPPLSFPRSPSTSSAVLKRCPLLAQLRPHPICHFFTPVPFVHYSALDPWPKSTPLHPFCQCVAVLLSAASFRILLSSAFPHLDSPQHFPSARFAPSQRFPPAHLAPSRFLPCELHLLSLVSSRCPRNSLRVLSNLRFVRSSHALRIKGTPHACRFLRTPSIAEFYCLHCFIPALPLLTSRIRSRSMRRSARKLPFLEALFSALLRRLPKGPTCPAIPPRPAPGSPSRGFLANLEQCSLLGFPGLFGISTHGILAFVWRSRRTLDPFVCSLIPPLLAR